MSSNNNTCYVFLLFSLISLLILDSADLTVARECIKKCGEVDIPYPFGIGEGCYLEKWYEIECVGGMFNLLVIGKEVVAFSLPQSTEGTITQGSIRIRNEVTSKGCSIKREELGSILNLTGTPFYVSPQNTLIAFGCSNTATLTNIQPTMVGCTSVCGTKDDHNPPKDILAFLNCDNSGSTFCEGKRNSTGNSCNGIGCCTADMPNKVEQVVGVSIDNNTTPGCKVAFLTDEAYRFPNTFDIKQIHFMPSPTVELGWFINTTNHSFVDSLGCLSSEKYGNLTEREEAYKQNCVCDSNSDLTYARCACTTGYRGNPYIPGDCKDFNECLQKEWDGTLRPVCSAGKTCVNTEGHYKCVSSYHRPLAIGMGSSFGSLIFIGGLYLIYKFIGKQRKFNRKKKFFKRNGGLLLQQQLTSNEGNVEKTKVFSSRELEKATENFSLNRILGEGGQGTVYKGMLVDGRIVAVKKSKVVDEDKLEEFINEVVILSQINHRNIVKLLGCCLETDVPVLVYEFIPNGNLFEHLHDDITMFTWEVRLRIAVDIAGALSYLHSYASSPIYHRDVKSTNIMMDEKYRAKVSDFGTSRSVTVDHTHLTTVVSGTMGYMDPEYFQTSQFTEKSDVYSFGVVLAELITGEKSISFLRSQENRTLATYFISAMKKNRLLEIIDARIKDSCKLNQVTAAAKIAKKCLNLKGRKRPSMREVSMELEKIRSSSGDMQPLEYISENEEEEEDTRVMETIALQLLENVSENEDEEEEGTRVMETIALASWNNVSVTTPSSRYNAATSLSSSSDIKPLFPLQTR